MMVAGISGLVVSSCAYDPYYSSTSYSAGYGEGYGYGGSNFSTSYFVSTGNPRWGYDPYARCYYDYNRRAYYDPYLSGYYPVGYRPRQVYGSPHPHSWASGRNYIAPPSRVRSYNLSNYHDRSERYRSLGHDWSRNVRVEPVRSGSYRSSSRDQYSRPDSYNRGQRYDSSRDRGSFGQPSQRDSRNNIAPQRSQRGNIPIVSPSQRGWNPSEGRQNEPRVNYAPQRSSVQAPARTQSTRANQAYRQSPPPQPRISPQRNERTPQRSEIRRGGQQERRSAPEERGERPNERRVRGLGQG